jgi:hypothetical protein
MEFFSSLMKTAPLQIELAAIHSKKKNLQMSFVFIAPREIKTIPSIQK